MDRIINVKVGGNYLSKDSKNAGVKGEGNVTKLRITFDEGWDEYAKTVTFFDAHGNNPVKRIQGVDLIEDIVNDTRTYITPIPPEPLAIAGELTFVIDGYVDGKRQRSIADKLVVKDSPDTDNAGEPTDPTPTQAEQLQKEIDGIKNTIQEAEASKNTAGTYAMLAQRAESSAVTAKNASEEAATNAEYSADLANSYAQAANIHKNSAREAADRAEESLTHSPIIVNGYWHVWDAQSKEYKNTEIKAQSGSTVYSGDNPPAEADIWLDPDGEGDEYYTKKEITELMQKFAIPSYAYVYIRGGADNWVAEDVTDDSGKVVGVRYGQIVNVNNAEITERSMVDLKVNSEQMVVFYEKDLAFNAENEDGVVTVYCVGNIPENDYKIQVAITEVTIDG